MSILQNKKVLTIVVILLLALGGWYFFSQKQSAETGNGVYTTDGNGSSTSSNLKDIFTKGLAQTCTYETEGNSGMVYVAGGAMRGDFATETDGQSIKSHMIVKDNTSYIWSDGEASGLKMTFDPASIEGTDSDTPVVNKQGTVDLSTEYNYKCSTWVSDSSKFDLPKGVEFASFDIPAMPAQGSGSGTSGSAPSQCSYCSALTGEDKAQCLTAFNCN